MSTNFHPPHPRLAAVVPAYNEAETIAEVLSVLKSVPRIEEILVVSDGSTDGTVDIARSLKMRTIHLRENHGKGTAMAVGVAHTDADILLFVDGDILNLTGSLLEQLMAPVLAGTSDMNVGVRNRGEIINAVQQRTGPLLSGIRCLRRQVFEAVPESHREGFAIETGLNWACAELGMRTTTLVMHNLKHLVKEKKRGVWRGMKARVRMFAAVFGAYLVLRFKPPVLRHSASGQPIFQPELDYINF